MANNGLLRFESVVKVNEGGDWRYIQSWKASDHPHSGMECFYDLDGTKDMTPQGAYEFAVSQRIPAQASQQLLSAWHCGLLH